MITGTAYEVQLKNILRVSKNATFPKKSQETRKATWQFENFDLLGGSIGRSAGFPTPNAGEPMNSNP